MKAVTYIRTSTDRQEHSPDAQASILASFAAKNGYTIERAYSEAATGSDDHREQLKLAAAHCKRTGATLLVSRLDRLARRQTALEWLQDQGIKFRIADQPEANELVLSILMAVAVAERKLIKTRTREGLAAAKAKGVKLGSHRPGSHSLNSEESRRGAISSAAKRRASAIAAYADLVPAMIEQRRQGWTLQRIAAELNAKGERTTANRPWSVSSVRRTLERSSY